MGWQWFHGWCHKRVHRTGAQSCWQAKFLMIDYIAEKYGITDRRRICMVGDRLDTDIMFGLSNGLQTCLTLSGVTTLQTLQSQDNNIRPDVYVDSIAAFFP